ncbi:unnamed protein product [Adineta steineri]|uniref:Uncharacterized protein n=1 Tax=Adineta steineri TaxID=433720 RepID=A0A819VTR5_9BILA|nr:unnamed protein product [Adineta steineri]CAF4113797.1 unnamed protein product [Adineta steineri]
MATETDISSSNTQIPVDSKKRRLWLIIKISVALLIIAALLTPIIIRLTRNKNTTTETMINTTVSFTTTTVPTDITPLTTKENNPTTISKTTTSSVSLTTTSSTTKPIMLQTFRRTNEVVYAIWNTSAGSNSSPSSPGQSTGTYWPTEPPEAALDGDLSTEYSNHGICIGSSPVQDVCGIETGFYITFKSEPFILVKFRIATNRNSEPRDPNTITIEGSNNTESDLVFGKSWSLVYDGDTGLATDPGRQAYGDTQTILNNSLSFRSYRILITSKRGEQVCVSYSEFEMIGRFPD